MRLALLIPLLCAVLLAEVAIAPPTAEARSPRWEFREGMREIARERREMRRDILRSQTREEARRAYREGMREISRERREMRREIRRSVNRRHAGRVVAGVVLGTILGAGTVGRIPPRPDPDLCWYWSDRSMTAGYWHYCDEGR